MGKGSYNGGGSIHYLRAHQDPNLIEDIAAAERRKSLPTENQLAAAKRSEIIKAAREYGPDPKKRSPEQISQFFRGKRWRSIVENILKK